MGNCDDRESKVNVTLDEMLMVALAMKHIGDQISKAELILLVFPHKRAAQRKPEAHVL